MKEEGVGVVVGPERRAMEVLWTKLEREMGVREFRGEVRTVFEVEDEGRGEPVPPPPPEERTEVRIFVCGREKERERFIEEFIL